VHIRKYTKFRPVTVRLAWPPIPRDFVMVVCDRGLALRGSCVITRVYPSRCYVVGAKICFCTPRKLNLILLNQIIDLLNYLTKDHTTDQIIKYWCVIISLSLVNRRKSATIIDYRLDFNKKKHFLFHNIKYSKYCIFAIRTSVSLDTS